jgi:hypothetical protein
VRSSVVVPCWLGNSEHYRGDYRSREHEPTTLPPAASSNRTGRDCLPLGSGPSPIRRSGTAVVDGSGTRRPGRATTSVVRRKAAWRRFALVGALVSVLLLSVATPAWAHAQLQSTEPIGGSSFCSDGLSMWADCT